jgi:hypothetical protein
MPTTTRAFLACCGLSFALAIATEAADGQDKPRLVPSNVKAAMTVTFAQDGKAVDLRIANPSEDWVVLEAEAVLRFPDTDSEHQRCLSRQQSDLQQNKGVLIAYATVCPLDITRTIKLVIQPKSHGSAYWELEAERKVQAVSIGEVRGREATLVERARAKLR